ncbi:pyridoxamine 5'-phosphate oxidase family protein [Streptomyces sp. Da 82-17]|uniref:pyridoxamine 5'-phosphate oxidase family protein n=1 Tax=Streptomyces sp. Da 82-17 TaxID=3377116 RepID=UPI0038D373D7
MNPAHPTAPAGPYHRGSRAVQDRVGVRALADHVGRSIGPGIRPVAAAFLEQQPMLVLGAAAADGRVWASLLTGPAGFVRATGPRQISVTGAPHPADPLTAPLAEPGVPVGTLALDPRTRRRMRLNGHARPTARGLAVESDEVFANCPKYLQRRETYDTVPGRTPAEPRTSAELGPLDRQLIATADTFFLATVGPDGADVSHRGGNPGFVRVDSARELSWPDYPGNAMFLTLGNLETDPRAGILLLDWTTGTTLQLTGTARTVHRPKGQRRVHFTLDRAVRTESASPLRWSPPEPSPANPPVEQGS